MGDHTEGTLMLEQEPHSYHRDCCVQNHQVNNAYHSCMGPSELKGPSRLVTQVGDMRC